MQKDGKKQGRGGFQEENRQDAEDKRGDRAARIQMTGGEEQTGEEKGTSRGHPAFECQIPLRAEHPFLKERGDEHQIQHHRKRGERLRGCIGRE